MKILFKIAMVLFIVAAVYTATGYLIFKSTGEFILPGLRSSEDLKNIFNKLIILFFIGIIVEFVIYPKMVNSKKDIYPPERLDKRGF